MLIDLEKLPVYIVPHMRDGEKEVHLKNVCGRRVCLVGRILLLLMLSHPCNYRFNHI